MNKISVLLCCVLVTMPLHIMVMDGYNQLFESSDQYKYMFASDLRRMYVPNNLFKKLLQQAKPQLEDASFQTLNKLESEDGKITLESNNIQCMKTVLAKIPWNKEKHSILLDNKQISLLVRYYTIMGAHRSVVLATRDNIDKEIIL